ncbi:iron-sulfur cluster scaffold-like protein [Mesoplasma syrphidae]|uniref:Iron-sulfur cluster scaffold-like protein n=1 Tax=Mesoplasma syrphidae TaxID=225999 RepID=A0A2K9BR02_9MOLU|nr:iron-sulfur cluster scaffold-like protein [Mesoplasma syrphidae]AUF83432.1 iron-sulfur cluster scaffold-like protein [Mesoplasma syrphidae]
MIDITNDQLLRDIIMQHFVNSRNRGFEQKPQSFYQDLRSESCSDELTLEIFKTDNDGFEIKFEGSACAISTAATDILISMIFQKSDLEIKTLLATYEKMIETGEITNLNLLGELIAFKNIFKQKNRKTCALLGSKGLKSLFNF